MSHIHNYVLGQWTPGGTAEYEARHAITGASIGTVASAGLNYEDILAYGRDKGGSSLRAMTFPERGLMLKALALHLTALKATYYTVSAQSGATKVDSWIDIDGGIGNLFAYATLRREFQDLPYYVEGQPARLSREGSFIGHHIMLPKRGVAVHINAFNFPIWGMLEKIAVNLLAGVPAVVKPSEYTSYVTEAMVRDIIASGILPEGALQLVSGKGRGILDHVQRGDVVSFTGSKATGYALKQQPLFMDRGVPFNLEADSLNAIVLGPDAHPESAEFGLFVKEVVREMTVKTGQKCTAVRRAMVPEDLLDAAQAAIAGRLAKTTHGDPSVEGTRMGSLASFEQIQRVQDAVQILSSNQTLVHGNLDGSGNPTGNHADGAFFAPVLFRCDDPHGKTKAHDVEAFGPVCTLMPYKGLSDAANLVAKGKGSLVTSIVTADKDVAKTFTLEAAYSNGRIHILDASCAKESTGHGSPMPLLAHGGPGRAGDGEEMGGMRGVMHYLQRTAVQGHPNMLSHIAGQHLPGADRPEASPHLFRQHFEEVKIGSTVTTESHLVTLKDIDDFAELSGDKFYAHMDENALDGTIFTGRVAHGYFILSRAAGLFVDPAKGPVLLNYGIDSCRFTKPVYPGTSVHVKLTVQEKINQEKRSEDDIAKGIVKYYVEVIDDENESVAVATILTMVRKLDQS